MDSSGRLDATAQNGRFYGNGYSFGYTGLHLAGFDPSGEGCGIDPDGTAEAQAGQLPGPGPLIEGHGVEAEHLGGLGDGEGSLEG